MLIRTVRLLTAAFLVLVLGSGCSLFGDDSTEDGSPDAAQPTLAGPSESLVAPPGTGTSLVTITQTKTCYDSPVSGGKADGRFYGSVTMLAGGSLKLTAKVEHAAKKAPKKRTVEVIVDEAGGFVAIFPVFSAEESLTLTAVEASGQALETPDATLEAVSADEAEECEALEL